MEIKVNEIIGKAALSMAKGNQLYEVIIPRIQQEDQLIINFEKVDTFATLFFNTSIGKLLKDYKPEELHEKVVFTNLNPVGSKLLKRSIKNSSDYFQNASMREAVDKIIPDIEGDLR